MIALEGLHQFPLRRVVARTSRTVRPVAISLAVGAALGLIVSVAGPRMALFGMVGLALLVAAFFVPEVLILIVLSLALELVPVRFNPFVNVGVGSLQVSDLLLLWLLFVVVFKALSDRSFRFAKTPLDLPVLLFGGFVLVGLGTAVFGYGIKFSDATPDARRLLFYLVFFAVTNLVRTQSQLTRLCRGLNVIGMLIAVIMILHSGRAPSSSALVVPPYFNLGVVRVGHPGVPAVYFALVTSVSLMASSGKGNHSAVRWLQALLLAAALFVTVTRNILAAAALSIGLLIVRLAKPQRTRLIINLLGATCLCVGLAGLLFMLGWESELVDYVVAFHERLSRAFSGEILSPDENLLTRLDEIKLAWAQLSRHPILGIGLHNPYRPPWSPAESPYLQTYIHNAYISLWLKSGLGGLGSFMWLSIVFLMSGFRRWQGFQDTYLRLGVLGLTAAYAGMMLSNLAGPAFVEPAGLSVFGVVLGLQQSILASGLTIRTEASVRRP